MANGHTAVLNAGSTPGAQAPPNPGIVFEMMQAVQKTAALKAAIDLDVFRAVGEGPGDVASIAKHAKASERGIRILCDFLVINGVLAKEGNRYKHTPSSAAFLDPVSPACLASVAQFLGNDAMKEPLKNLAQVVRDGRTSLEGEGTVEPENPVWVQFAETMAPMMAPMAGPLAAVVLERRDGPMRVLDIAAGHGLFGIEVAKQNKQAHVTGLDWAPVLRVALKNAEKAGVRDRYDMLPGSAFEVDFGGPYDVVLLTNFLHHFDKETCGKLLKKVHGALKPGGYAATLEFVPNEDRVSPPMAAGFAMSMLATTVAGDAYTFSELKAMYEDAGFKDVKANPIPMSPHTIVIGCS
ncbi:class I SAM-dependent methyltransferase [Occallatibacter savannae]|uniref:class I SAM-dependent methyltransferase n=1 Tax=Occallatibacter savannae TaxID=1002691 RepID=UPI000D69FE68|nr:class I SAM-dependent methyltransferase [Occallatibacter savannae]